MESRISTDAGLTFFPHEAQIHGIEDDSGLRRVLPHRGHVPRGDVGTRNDRQAEIAAVLFQKVASRAVAGGTNDLDPDALEVLQVRREHGPVVGNERDVMAPSFDATNQLHHPK